jgi:hypothetical protein
MCRTGAAYVIVRLQAGAKMGGELVTGAVHAKLQTPNPQPQTGWPAQLRSRTSTPPAVPYSLSRRADEPHFDNCMETRNPRLTLESTDSRIS